ncbi:hypothetical protein HMPREF3201_00530 [Megasphaera sp. MJR8396C]|nr:hypothetical protein HMPREF3201_00530 [Megasphaera sp. MJR8396C]
MVLAEMTLSCAGLYIVMLAEFTGLVDDEAFEHDEGTAFGVEKIIFADNAQSGPHGRMAKAADLKVRALFAAGPAQSLGRQPVRKGIFFTEFLFREGGLGCKKEGLGVFPFQGFGQAVPTEPPGADDDRFCPRKPLFRSHTGCYAFIKGAARRFFCQPLLEACLVLVHLVDGNDAAVIVAGQSGLTINGVSQGRRIHEVLLLIKK